MKENKEENLQEQLSPMQSLKNLLEEKGGRIVLDQPVFVDYEFSDGFDGGNLGDEYALYAKEFYIKKDRIFAVTGQVLAESDDYPSVYDENYPLNNSIIKKRDLICEISSTLGESPEILNTPQEVNESNYLTLLKETPATVFEEYTAGGYSARTYENARQADITLAFATDFTTAGEKCTEKAAGNTRIPVILNGPLIGGRTIEYFVRQLITDINLKCRVLGIDKGNLRLNIAGNGIYTLAKSGYTQADTDKLITDVLAGIQDRDGIHISSIRSGGQTGVDEAGVKAGRALGLPTTVLAPKGWAFRIVDGNGNHRDIYDERAFKARFGVTTKKAVRQAPVRNASAGPRWTPVRSRDGKWNYRDAAGHLLAGAWLDKAEPFRDGKAVIERGGTRAEINEEGVVTAILAQKMGGPKL